MSKCNGGFCNSVIYKTAAQNNVEIILPTVNPNHYENLPMQYTENFQVNKLKIFSIEKF